MHCVGGRGRPLWPRGVPFFQQDFLGFLGCTVRDTPLHLGLHTRVERQRSCGRETYHRIGPWLLGRA